MDTTHFRALLRSQSYKATPSRLSILAVLSRAKKPLSAQAILQKLGKRRLDQATVYRTLLTLKEMGIVKQIDFQHGLTYYELSSLGEHHHVICTTCEKVEDVRDCCAANIDTIALRQSGFSEITHHSLEFFGLCKKCRGYNARSR